MSRINHNAAAQNAWRNLTMNDGAMTKNLERLTSGFRINRAADDAAGLAISEKMRGQFKGLGQAVRNAHDGISMIQTAEGALNETHSILQRMRELAVQSSNDSNTLDERKKIQQEMDQLAGEVTRVANTTEFNTKNLLGGFFSGKFHIGANENQTMDVAVSAMDAATLGVARDKLDVKANGAAVKVTASSTSGDLLLDSGTYTVKATESYLGTTGAVSHTVGGADEKLVLTVNGVDQTVTFAANKTYTAQEQVDAINAQIGSFVTASLDQGKIVVTNKNDNETLAVKGGVGGTDAAVATDTGLAVGAANQFDYRLYSGATLKDSVTGGTAATSITFGGVGVNVTLDGTQTSALNEASVDVYASAVSTAASQTAAGTLINASVQGGIDIRTQAKAELAITSIDTAIKSVSDQRSKLGAIQNRLEHTIANLQVASENLTAAESRIRDVDMASEMSTFTKNQILMQAGTAMLAQANQKNQGVLQLLR